MCHRTSTVRLSSRRSPSTHPHSHASTYPDRDFIFTPVPYWSDLTLVYWDEAVSTWQAYDLLRDLDPDRRINLLRVDERWLTADQLWQIERHLVEL